MNEAQEMRGCKTAAAWPVQQTQPAWLSPYTPQYVVLLLLICMRCAPWQRFAVRVRFQGETYQLRSRQARRRRPQLVAHAAQPRRDGGPPRQPLRCAICPGILLGAQRTRVAGLRSSRVAVSVHCCP